MKNLSIYKNCNVIVTGTTGFKGSWLSFWLHNLGAKVVGIGLKPESGAVIFKSLKLAKKIKQYYLNICNFDSLNSIVKKEKPDIIFHLAAQSVVSLSYQYPLETIRTNVLGSTNILESCRINKIKNLVFITSDKCYLNREVLRGYKENEVLGGYDNYSSSKASAEIIFKSYYKSFFERGKLLIASARAGNVIGGGDFKKDRIVPDTIKSLSTNKDIILRNPNSTRPWQHVLEPISGYLRLGQLLINKKLNSKLIPSWNFGPLMHNCRTVNEIVIMLTKEWGGNPKKIKFIKSKKFKEAKLLALNINKARKELKWKPRLSLKNTIKLTVDWYKKYFLNAEMSNITIEQINLFKNLKD